ncbi:MAG: beta-phosphoglucomutase family hydrolase [Bacteroidales bacterium]|nr:beta-phosphoglucomutase family hydrolase [Bacteroidales bacterium]
MPEFDAVIFDLDGVITKTALVHGSAWKKMFDEYLRSREERFGEPFREFTHADDYLPYVDGKPRYKGVDSFLKSRGIDIPFGDPSDDPEKETVCALGNRKNLLFNKVLDEEGVQVYETSVALIKQLREQGVRIGVASSSKNCKPVLETAGLMHYFETRIDGVVSAEIGLHGKPEPDIFTTACDRLGVPYHKAVVVEDAVSGVQAGRNGNFGLTIGVAREENVGELQINGGDIVVEDLGEISVEELNNWFRYGIEDDSWRLNYYDYDHEKERSRETLLAVGNGYFGTRGALEESDANSVNYPGTYISGLFNRRTSEVAGRDIENEDFVNISNWLPVSFRIKGGDWFEFKPDPTFRIEKIHRQLDMRNGTLFRFMIVSDRESRKTLVKSMRFAGMHDPHRAAVNYSITPLNYSEHIEIQSIITADHINAGVERYSELEQEHLEPVSENAKDNILQLLVETNDSGIRIGMAAKHRINRIHIQGEIKTGRAKISELFKMEARAGEEITLEKMVTLFTTIPNDSEDPIRDAVKAINDVEGFFDELKKSEKAWKAIWERINIRVAGDRNAQRLLHLHQYHMMVTASPFHAALDSGIPPRGLHGEAYRGHIFWDELYMLPFYNLHFPEIPKSTLMYRYKRLDAARKYAKEYGYEGAMFPWQSGSDGREETQIVHLNPLSGEWGEDYSSLQRHISLAIAYNLYNYYHHNHDREFMVRYGNELYFDICKFWISKTSKGKDERYHIDKVMGPDEFHEKLPGSEEGGLTDNAYTNIMVSWMLSKAELLKKDFAGEGIMKVMDKLGISETDFDHWKEVERKLALHINQEGIIEHFMGYFELEELDWDAYREKYGDIHRLDRILKAEGKSPDAYKLSKQADLMMVFYNLGNDEATRIIQTMGYTVPDDYIQRNFDYYIRRTSHGSTLSRLVHARLAFKAGMDDTGMKLYKESLESDLNDIQGGTTGEGIHCGVMAGTIYDALVAFAGLDVSGEIPALDPDLPGHWTGMEFKFGFRNDRISVKIHQSEIRIKATETEKNKIKLHICGREVEVEKEKEIKVKF